LGNLLFAQRQPSAADLRGLLDTFGVRHSPTEIKTLLSDGTKRGLSPRGVLSFAADKLQQKRDQHDPIYSVKLLINGVNGSDLRHWTIRGRRDPAYFGAEAKPLAGEPTYLRGDIQAYVADCARQLREVGDYEEIAGELEQALSDQIGRPDAVELEERLSILDARMLAIARDRQTPEEELQLKEELKEKFASYRRRKTVEQLAMIERQHADRVLSERGNLPRLSLFYVDAAVTRAA
jgi:hypothetical protein